MSGLLAPGRALGPVSQCRGSLWARSRANPDLSDPTAAWCLPASAAASERQRDLRPAQGFMGRKWGSASASTHLPVSLFFFLGHTPPLL